MGYDSVADITVLSLFV